MSYDVTDRFTLDFGYRYLDLGDAKSGTVIRLRWEQRPYGGVEIRDVTSHDLMLSAPFRARASGAVIPPRSSNRDLLMTLRAWLI